MLTMPLCALYYTLGATFFVNIFSIFHANSVLSMIWRSVFTITPRRTADQPTLGEYFSKRTMSVSDS